jgi:hypothetical protein
MDLVDFGTMVSFIGPDLQAGFFDQIGHAP